MSVLWVGVVFTAFAFCVFDLAQETFRHGERRLPCGPAQCGSDGSEACHLISDDGFGGRLCGCLCCGVGGCFRISQPQNEHIELHQKRFGKKFDHDEIK
jgi:hypothetical protein